MAATSSGFSIFVTSRRFASSGPFLVPIVVVVFPLGVEGLRFRVARGSLFLAPETASAGWIETGDDRPPRAV